MPINGGATEVQMAEGATFAIVPYVGSHLGALGPVAGIVGAGGNAGAVGFGWIYKLYAGEDDRMPFMRPGPKHMVGMLIRCRCSSRLFVWILIHFTNIYICNT